MLLRNLDFSAGRMLVNGSRGVVIGFKARKVSAHRPPTKPDYSAQPLARSCSPIQGQLFFSFRHLLAHHAILNSVQG